LAVTGRDALQLVLGDVVTHNLDAYLCGQVDEVLAAREVHLADSVLKLHTLYDNWYVAKELTQRR